MADINKLAAEIVSLSLLEAQALKNILKQQYGIGATPACSTMTTPAPDTKPSNKHEKQTFDIILKSAGAARLEVIKIVNSIMGQGLKEAKYLVENAPKALLEGVSKAEAEDIQSKLADAGAEVDIV